MAARLHHLQENSCFDYFNRKVDNKNIFSKVTSFPKRCVSTRLWLGLGLVSGLGDMFV